MTEISAVRINANGTYSDYFQISDDGAIIFQGSSNPNNITTTPLPASGDLYICTSIPELFIYDGTEWVPIGESSSGFYSQNITTSGIIIGQGISYTGTLYASVNISSPSTLTLPTPQTAGTTIIVKDETGLAGTNTITLSSEDSSTIDGQTSVIIDINWGSYTFLYNGTNWTIISAISSFPLNQLLLGGGNAAAYTLPAISPYLSYVNNFESQNYIAGNITTGQVLAAISVVDNLYFPENFVGSIANCLTVPQNEVVINISVGSTNIGSLIFSPNDSIGYFTTSAPVNINPGSVLIFTASSYDSSITGISFTLSASALFNQIEFNPYIKITNTLPANYNTNTPFEVFGNVFPRESNVNIGYTTSDSIPPSSTISVSSDLYGNWNGTLTIASAGTYYVWAQINNSDNYTYIETDIIQSYNLYTNTPSSNQNFTVGTNGCVAITVSGSVNPSNATILVGFNESNSIAPTSWMETIVANSSWSTTLTICTTGTYYIWSEIYNTSVNNNIETIVDALTLPTITAIANPLGLLKFDDTPGVTVNGLSNYEIEFGITNNGSLSGVMTWTTLSRNQSYRNIYGNTYIFYTVTGESIGNVGDSLAYAARISGYPNTAILSNVVTVANETNINSTMLPYWVIATETGTNLIQNGGSSPSYDQLGESTDVSIFQLNLLSTNNSISNFTVDFYDSGSLIASSTGITNNGSMNSPFENYTLYQYNIAPPNAAPDFSSTTFNASFSTGDVITFAPSTNYT